MSTSNIPQVVNPPLSTRIKAWLARKPQPKPKRFIYETKGERRENGTVTGYGTYHFSSPKEAHDGIYAMLGGYSRSGKGMFSYMTPLERIDLDTGERTDDYDGPIDWGI